MTAPVPSEEPVKKIVVASDHAGYRYKRRIIEHLTQQGYQVEDFGTDSTESVDYPDFIFPAAKAVAAGEFERGIVLGGSGNGEAIAANRVKGVRCALCWNEKSARLARQHNNANMISLGERMVSMHDVYEIIDIWLSTPFEGGRHQRRIEKLDE
ncbi:ribose 5-phosphate isomerase B [Gimesia chilikensis]|jgi:ribose 5-phosphate isomerase B|uniref:Ribose-5-phosphate isomerase B n=1 Tax=Gimesia chilikensis TaxID=2605989 RepID=A0A517PI03_9PLAN|nr:ribose 5-phosphate isomerase B [Gimesia chilikensis]MBN71124.1 ribose 5-phosphate isomerase B [Gimesia sp.]MCR9234890.1 ribose 5-phosphate isomerase B [bacterium]QDT19007.1 Ribose-5-phosphate isomerase B [Gimesia chilikensis]QDT83116.1 Ribose-5-phosphate isomerase B [Gimesia chilikensis]